MTIGTDGAIINEGNPAALPAGAGINGEPPTPIDIFAELDKETREWVEKRHKSDPLALARQALEADRFAGSAVQVPKDDATPEDVSKFFERLGRPKEATGYELAPPENMPDTVTYNAEAAEWFRNKAFESGLSQKQARALHDAFVGYTAEMETTMAAEQASSAEAVLSRADAELVKAWGPKDDATFRQNLELAGRGMRVVDPDGKLAEDLKKVGWLGPNREVLVPSLAVALAKLARGAFAEDATLGNGSNSGSGENPFETDNLTAAMALIKADPVKARELLIRAGRKPVEFGL